MNLLCCSQGPVSAACRVSAVPHRRVSPSAGECPASGSSRSTTAMVQAGVFPKANVLSKREMAKPRVCRKLVCEDERWAWCFAGRFRMFGLVCKAGSLCAGGISRYVWRRFQNFTLLMSPPTLNGHCVPKAHATADATGTQHCQAVSFFFYICWLWTARASPGLSWSHGLLQTWFSQLWSLRAEGTYPHHSAHGDVTAHPWSSLLAKGKVLWCWLLSLCLRKCRYFKQRLFHYCGERDCAI